MNYELNFRGREVGAIGILSDYCVTLQADSIEKAWIKLYDTHEHITRKHWRIIPTAKQTAKTKNLMRNL